MRDRIEIHRDIEKLRELIAEEIEYRDNIKQKLERKEHELADKQKVIRYYRKEKKRLMKENQRLKEDLERYKYMYLFT